MAISRFKTSTLAQGLPKYQDVWDGISAVFDSDYELIERVVVGAGGAASIAFSSIPSTYKHLQIRGITRNDRNDNGSQSTTMSFNGDTTHTNYRSHLLYGGGTTANGETNQLSGYYGATGFTPAANMLANVFSSQITDILDYKNASKNKTARTFWGVNSNGGSEYVGLSSFLWMNTNAITSISIQSFPSANFVQYSQFALYGIRGAS